MLDELLDEERFKRTLKKYALEYTHSGYHLVVTGSSDNLLSAYREITMTFKMAVELSTAPGKMVFTFC